jgi:hypothetical protein
MEKPRVVVRAALDGETIRIKPGEARYAFKKGEMGVLRWEWHKEDSAYLMPLVMWDNDPECLVHCVSYSYIDEVGIEQNGTRFCLDSR